MSPYLLHQQTQPDTLWGLKKDWNHQQLIHTELMPKNPILHVK